jgi:hypothetical protein
LPVGELRCKSFLRKAIHCIRVSSAPRVREQLGPIASRLARLYLPPARFSVGNQYRTPEAPAKAGR